MTTTVCVFSAAHGRLAVSELVLRQRSLLLDELRNRGVEAVSLVLADDGNLDIARGLGMEAVPHANAPLGAKCSAGLRRAAALADHVMWVGSDDWVHPDVAGELLGAAGGDESLVHAGARLAVVDLPRGRLTRIASHSLYGAIPWLIDSRLLRGREDPIPPRLERGLDGALVRGMRRSGVPFRFERHDPHEFRCVDFKTPANLHPYATLAESRALAPEEDAWPALFGRFPRGLVDAARRLHEEGKWRTST